MRTPNFIELSLPEARILYGCGRDGGIEQRTKDGKGNPLLTKEGKPRHEWVVGLGIPKKPGELAFWQTSWGAQIYAAGRASFPNLFAPDGSLIPGRKFSWKVQDGDSQEYDQNGKRWCDKEHYPGNWVVTLKTQLQAPSLWTSPDGKQFLQADPKCFKNGYWVVARLTADSNNDPQKSGLFMNPQMLLYVKQDAEIVSRSDDPSGAFAGTVSAQAPVGSTPAVGSASPSLPPPGAAAAPAPAPAPVQTAVQPHPSIMTPAAPPPPAAPPAPPAGPQTKPGSPYTWEALQKSGWSEAAARQQGYIL